MYRNIIATFPPYHDPGWTTRNPLIGSTDPLIKRVKMQAHPEPWNIQKIRQFTLLFTQNPNLKMQASDLKRTIISKT
jgi:hypothetical protein